MDSLLATPSGASRVSLDPGLPLRYALTGVRVLSGMNRERLLHVRMSLGRSIVLSGPCPAMF